MSLYSLIIPLHKKPVKIFVYREATDFSIDKNYMENKKGPFQGGWNQSYKKGGEKKSAVCRFTSQARLATPYAKVLSEIFGKSECEIIHAVNCEISHFFLVWVAGFPPVAALADKQSFRLFGPTDKLLKQFSPYFKSRIETKKDVP